MNFTENQNLLICLGLVEVGRHLEKPTSLADTPEKSAMLLKDHEDIRVLPTYFRNLRKGY